MFAFLQVSAFLRLVLFAGAAGDCHPRCHCEVETFGLFGSFSLTKVDCSRVGLAVGPVPIPLDTYHLDLSSNSIHEVTGCMLSGTGYTTLTSLDMSNNLISEISHNAFSKLRYLETLDLSLNSLERLPDCCFSGLPLTEVDLSNNKMQEIRLDVFFTKAHMRPISVDLSDNLLVVVSWYPQAMGTPNLQSLTLSRNRLRTVPELKGIPLRYLSLDGNPISSIEKDAFTGLKDLTHLSLSSLPKLSTIQPHSFRDLQNLQTIVLSNNNNLVSLSPEVFVGLVSLQELDLSNSGLSFSPNDILNHLPNLSRITLIESVNCWRTH